MKRIIKTALSLLLTVGLLLPAGLYYVTSAEETTGQVAEPTLKPEEPLEEDIEALAEELIDELRTDSKFVSYIDEKEFENKEHVARLYDLEEENSYVFKNADGTRALDWQIS